MVLGLGLGVARKQIYLLCFCNEGEKEEEEQGQLVKLHFGKIIETSFQSQFRIFHFRIKKQLIHTFLLLATQQKQRSSSIKQLQKLSQSNATFISIIFLFPNPSNLSFFLPLSFKREDCACQHAYNIIIMNVWEDNDYQQTKMRKILILQCLDLNLTQQFQIELPYDYENRELDLGFPLTRILQDIIHNPTEQQVFYFHPINHHYVYAGLYPFKSLVIIGEDFISAQEITVRVRRLGSSSENLFDSKEPQNEKEKKPRASSRTIREVLEKVSEWREINQKNPKITLDQAAKIMKIPKKTLDDYYMQIKVASDHHFDFQKNLNEKIGVLRKFAKQNNMKKKELELQFLPQLLKKQSDDEQQEQEEE